MIPKELYINSFTLVSNSNNLFEQEFVKYFNNEIKQIHFLRNSITFVNVIYDGFDMEEDEQFIYLGSYINLREETFEPYPYQIWYPIKQLTNFTDKQMVENHSKYIKKLINKDIVVLKQHEP